MQQQLADALHFPRPDKIIAMTIAIAWLNLC